MNYQPEFGQVKIYNREDGRTKIEDCYGNYVIVRGLENIKKKISKKEHKVFEVPEYINNFKKIYDREYIEIEQIHILEKTKSVSIGFGEYEDIKVLNDGCYLCEETIKDVFTVLIKLIEELFPNRIILINTNKYKKYLEKKKYIDISKEIEYKNGHNRIYRTKNIKGE